jgi:hypothetical protein
VGSSSPAPVTGTGIVAVLQSESVANEPTSAPCWLRANDRVGYVMSAKLMKLT